MSWEQDLEKILSDLGVQQERAQSDQPTEDEPFVLMLPSHRSPGVTYRLELTEADPELRVFLPTNDGPYKVHIYLVTLAPGNMLLHLFGLCMGYQGGSRAYQEVEGGINYHLLMMLMHAMKNLFWQGDLASLWFPPEIQVRLLL